MRFASLWLFCPPLARSLPRGELLLNLIEFDRSPQQPSSPLEPPVQPTPQFERTRRLAESPIPQLLLRLSLPAVVGMLTAGVYNFVDRAFVGQAIGQNGLAGVTAALPYMLTLMASGMLIGFGAAAQVSIKLGEKQIDNAERVLGNAALLAIILSAVLTAAGLPGVRPGAAAFPGFDGSFSVRP